MLKVINQDLCSPLTITSDVAFLGNEMRIIKVNFSETRRRMIGRPNPQPYSSFHQGLSLLPGCRLLSPRRVKQVKRVQGSSAVGFTIYHNMYSKGKSALRKKTTSERKYFQAKPTALLRWTDHCDPWINVEP